MAKRKTFAPYLFEDWRKASETQMDMNRGFQSVFKKPYQFDDFQRMERIGDSHSTNPARTSGLKQGPYSPAQQPPGGGDVCQPTILKFEGSYFDCDCDVDCCIILTISCAPNVKAVNIGGQEFRPTSGMGGGWFSDGVNLIITACGFPSDSDVPFEIETMTARGKTADQRLFKRTVKSSGIKTELSATAHYEDGRITGIFHNNCICDDADENCQGCADPCPIDIDTGDINLDLGDSQEFNVTGGAGCYKWQAIPNVGTFNTTEGQTVTYTAPSFPPNCITQVLISVTDVCKKTTSVTVTLTDPVDWTPCSDWDTAGTPPTWSYQCPDDAPCSGLGPSVYFTSQENVFPSPPPTTYSIVVYGHNCHDGCESFYTASSTVSMAAARASIIAQMDDAGERAGWVGGTNVTDLRTPAEIQNGCCPEKLDWTP